MSFTLGQLQAEQPSWIKQNFGERPAWMPLLGICEEVSEFIGARRDNRPDDVTDALADCMIFATDYCSGMGWDAATVWEERSFVRSCKRGPIESELAFAVGRLQHHHLKAAQGIRTNENHDHLGKAFLGVVFFWIDMYCCIHGTDLMTLVHTTWQRVRKRDWQRDPVTGNEGANDGY